MPTKKRMGIFTWLLPVLLLTSGSLAAAAVTEKEEVIWELTKTKVVDPGQIVETKEGTVTTGVTIEAKARLKNSDTVRKGRIKLTFSTFTPRIDMGPQKKGQWYVRGKWRLRTRDVDPDSVGIKHHPEVIRGNLTTELPFDPLSGAQGWSAKASLPMSLAAGRWSKGGGSFTFNRQLEGDLYLDLSYPSKKR